MRRNDGPAEMLRQAVPGSESFFDIYSRLSEAIPEGGEDEYRAAIWAFAYYFISPEDPESRAREQSPFGAMFEFNGQRLPPRLSDVDADDVGTWATLFDSIDDPRAAARLGDLLWERRHGDRPDEYARAACTALLEISQDPTWEPMESTDCLVRAAELATSLRDHALLLAVTRVVTEIVGAEIASNEDRPGISITLLGVLADLPAELRPEGLSFLIDQAEAKHGSDPYLFQALHDLRASLAGADELEALRVEQVQNWRAAATKAEGIVRLSLLQSALDLARAHGLTTEADELRVELDSISDEDLGLTKISAEAHVDQAEIDRLIDHFVRDGDWRGSLTRFGAHGPPGGEPADADEELRKQREGSPFQFLATQMIVDPDTGNALFRAEEDGARSRVFRAQQRMLAARIWAVLAANVLERIVARFGRPPRDELAEFFVSGVVDRENAERIAQAFELYWDGDPDLAAHVLAPRLEAVIRDLARRLGLPIFDEPVGDRPGRVRSLGRVMRQLDGRMPSPGWHAYLTLLLSEPLGLNLRNVVAHGLRSQISRDDAVLLLHAACFLRLVTPLEET